MAVFEHDDIEIAYDVVGAGPAVLLVHGFPQTRAMWGLIANGLARDFTVVTADLRGYGASSKPEALDDLSNYSFRSMGRDMFALMSSLGHERFHLIGHDRGGRVAHRMSLDRPERIATLTVMDIVPTHTLLARWSSKISAAYFHWSFLAQPAPFPERMISADRDHFFEACLLGWGGARIEDFAEIEAYRTAWRDPAAIAGMTNDYRAALAVDVHHDEVDVGRKFDGPALVLYGSDGAMARIFDIPETWSAWLENMTAEAIPGGHFFPDQSPDATLAALRRFLGVA
ncbi:MAG: alpha/beta hydrolase [Boseongicola sp.]|nr:alpha/beta hydrolase [Boseongicola sp.]NNJ68405.1 alpha/beta hydrolase [Boseongicola sp.]